MCGGMKRFILLGVFNFLAFSNSYSQICIGYTDEILDQVLLQKGYSFVEKKDNALIYSNERDSIQTVQYLNDYNICVKSVMVFPSNRTFRDTYNVLNNKGISTDLLTWKIPLKNEDGYVYAIITRYPKNYTLTFEEAKKVSLVKND
jgi:hypothetical protein